MHRDDPRAPQRPGGALRLGVLVSGRGSNLQAILDACAEGRLAAEVAVVVSNVGAALALERAAKAGVPTRVLEHRGYASREAFDAALVAELRAHAVELVVLAGFMRIVTPVLLTAFPERVVNVHPALLPAFPGMHAQRQALDYGARVTGCTVHLVDAGVDTGPVLAQRAVPVVPGDTEETLSARLLVEEHHALVDVLAAFAEGRVRVEPPRAPGARVVTRITPRPE
jgi:phosphoribosylglycinamide formyltransferase-1